MSKRLSLSLAVCVILAAQVSLGQQATYTEGQKVEVREGDTWSAATIVKKEGRKYLIRYQGATDEDWVTTDRIRGAGGAGSTSSTPSATPGTSVAPAAPVDPAFDKPAGVGDAAQWKLNQKVEAKRGAAWRAATVFKLQNGWVLVFYAPGNFKEWVEPWRIRAVGSNDDPIGNAPMHPEVKDDQAAPAEPPGDAPGANAGGPVPRGWREPKAGDRVIVFDGDSPRPGVLAERRPGQVRVIAEGWNDRNGRWVDERDALVSGSRLDAKVGDRVQIRDGSWKHGTVVAREPERVRVAIDGWEADMFQKWKSLDEIRPRAENDIPPAKGLGADALKRTPGYQEADTSMAQELTLIVSKAKFVPDAIASTAGATTRPAVHGAAIRGAAGEARPRTIVEARGGAATAGGAVVASQVDNQDTIYLDRINPATGEVVGKADVNVGKDMVLEDISPDGTHVLFRKNNRGDRLEMWNIEPGSGAGGKRELILFPYVVEKQMFHDITSAMFVGNDRFITTGGQNGELYLWNAKSGKAIYHCAHTRTGVPALSVNGKYLALSTGKDAVVIDAATGRGVADLPEPLASATHFAFSPSGKQLLATDGTTIWAVNLETGELYRDFTMPGSFSITSIACPADGYALLSNTALVDLERRSPLWKYELPANTPATVLSSGQLAYALDNDGRAATLVMASVPHAAVLKAAQTMPESELLLKPGASISLQMNVNCTPDEQAKIMQNLTSQLEASQIKVTQGAMLQLILSLEQGKSEQREYGSGPSFGPFARAGEKVTITRKISRIRIEFQGRTIWEVVANSGEPGMMIMRRGNQSMQEAVDEQSKPNMGIFQTVRLPAYLVMPRNPMYMGASELSTRGFRDKKAEAEPAPEPTRPPRGNPNGPNRGNRPDLPNA